MSAEAIQAPPVAPSKRGLPLLAKIVLGCGAVLAALILLAFVVGIASPPEHEVAVSATFTQPAEELFATMADWEHYPEWRRELAGVRRVDDPEGDPRWFEDWEGDMDVELELTAQEPPRHLAIKIHDPSESFDGAWDIQLQPAEGGTTVTITERGTIKQPLARGVMTLVPGAKGMCLRMFLDGLSKKYGGTP